MKPYIILNTQDIRRFREYLLENGRSAETAKGYESRLRKLYACLPEGKKLNAHTMEDYLAKLQIKYSVSTINVFISTYNSFMLFMKRADLSIQPRVQDKQERPELTRGEYLRLLETAKRSDMRQSYLLVMLFGNTELGVTDMDALTVEAVREGVIHGRDSVVRLPELLKNELLAYADDAHVLHGPLFQTSSGNAYDRARVTKLVSALGKAARIEPKKVNPRSLRKLYSDTLHRTREQYEQIIMENLISRLEIEQLSVGWDHTKRI